MSPKSNSSHIHFHEWTRIFFFYPKLELWLLLTEGLVFRDITGLHFSCGMCQFTVVGPSSYVIHNAVSCTLNAHAKPTLGWYMTQKMGKYFSISGPSLHVTNIIIKHKYTCQRTSSRHIKKWAFQKNIITCKLTNVNNMSICEESSVAPTKSN